VTNRPRMAFGHGKRTPRQRVVPVGTPTGASSWTLYAPKSPARTGDRVQAVPPSVAHAGAASVMLRGAWGGEVPALHRGG
jgi:hypothetical protein